jgi:periplasmic protein TonB
VVLAPYYRRYELPWEGDPEASNRFRRLLAIGSALFVLFTLVVWLVDFPAPKQTAAEAVPERLARLMVQEKPKPPPPPPPPKPIDPPKAETKPQPKPVPDKVVEARKQAEKSLNKVRDELADLRRDLARDLPTQTRNLTGAVGADSKAERSLITSKAGTGSAGVQSTNSSRGYGSGAGSLTGHATTAVSSSVATIASDNKAQRTGNSGKAARSQEEIELEFDRNKGAIYALYSRALRERPELQGKMVLEFTISSSGEVTACRVVSSELNDPELERKIVARVRQIRFPAREVESITTTKPIEFFPG